MQQIEEWLERLGMSAYAQQFLDNRIDLAVLEDLNDQDLRELGVILGDRKKILRAIRELHSAASAAAPETSAEAAERRQVTVMFCDLIGSTALSTRLDPEDLRKIIGAYHRTCAAVVERNGGFVAKYMGDGVLVYFGYPRAHEHDAEHAVQAALGLIDAVAELDQSTRLEVRVGIATGLVVVGDIVGSGEAQERGIIGETPNLAARLQALAEPGTVVIADTTRRLLGELFLVRSLGQPSLKGISRAVEAWAVSGANVVDSRFEAFHGQGLSPLVARERECETLRRCWSRARSAEGQTVLITGEAGIGKSRLVAAMVEQIASDALTRLRYDCSPQHSNTTLYPVIKHLERRAAIVHDDDPKTKLDKLDVMLARSSVSGTDKLLLADLLELANDGRYPVLDLSPVQRRQRTLEAVLQTITGLARSEPILLTFEDLHWADPTSLELLGQLVCAISALPVLLIATFRPEFQSPWRDGAGITTMTIDRLDPAQTEAFISGLAGDQSLSAEVRREIVNRADGIPLFVQEMTKAVLEGASEAGLAAAIPAMDSVPASLNASLMSRLDRLGRAKDVAQIAAVIGREFSYSLLASVARLTDAELNHAIDSLVRARLIFRQDASPETSYLFNHALVQEAAYGALLREKRRALHADIASAIETRFSGAADSQPEVLARHCTEAGLHEKAASLWSKAGRRSLARSALVEAAEQLSRALHLIETLPQTSALRHQQATLQIELANALLHIKGHAAPETRAAFDRARMFMERAEGFAEATEDALILFAVPYGFWVASRMSFNADVTRELAAQFQALAGQRQAVAPIMIGHLLMGISLVLAGEFATGTAELDRAVALYDHARHRSLATHFGHDVLVSALSWRAFSQWALGRLDAARVDVDHAMSEARESGHAATLMYALAHVSLTLIYLGRLAAASENAEELMRLAVEKRSSFWKAYGMLLRGRVHSIEGQHGTAADMLDAGISMMRSTGATAYEPWYLSILGEAYAGIGRHAEAAQCIEKARRRIEETGEAWQHAESCYIAGKIAMSSDPPDMLQAKAHFERSLMIARQQDAQSFERKAAEALAIAR